MKRTVLFILLMAALAVMAASQSTPVYKETIIHNFDHRNGDYYPSGGLSMDRFGNIYGMVEKDANGALFELTQDSSGHWVYSLLCDCGGAISNGYLAMDASGNLYGTDDVGQVYEYSPGPSGWSGTQAYVFGIGGTSPVIVDASGNVYGITKRGGAYGKGFVFQFSPVSDGIWTMSHLHDFNGTDGAVGMSALGVGALIMDRSGNLCGTTDQGGSSTQCESGCGVVFELTNLSGTWREKVLHSFSGADGMNPSAQLLMDSVGNLYGTTAYGGVYGAGAVFKTSFTKGTWRTKTIYSFTNSNGDGAFPNSPLIMDGAGNLFSTTTSGGSADGVCSTSQFLGCGTVFELKAMNGAWKETILHHFTGLADGAFPAGILLGRDGALYGSAQGGRFEMGLVYKLSRK